MPVMSGKADAVADHHSVALSTPHSHNNLRILAREPSLGANRSDPEVNEASLRTVGVGGGRWGAFCRRCSSRPTPRTSTLPRPTICTKPRLKTSSANCEKKDGATVGEQ